MVSKILIIAIVAIAAIAFLLFSSSKPAEVVPDKPLGELETVSFNGFPVGNSVSCGNSFCQKIRVVFVKEGPINAGDELTVQTPFEMNSQFEKVFSNGKIFNKTVLIDNSNIFEDLPAGGEIE